MNNQIRPNRACLKLKIKLGEFVLWTIPSGLLLLIGGAFIQKGENTLTTSNIKITATKNFIADLSRKMDAPIWDLGAYRIKNDGEFVFLDGNITFRQCTAQTTDKVQAAFNQYNHLLIKEDELGGKYLCIDGNILLRMNFYETSCEMGFSAKWHEDYSRCKELME